MIDPLLHLIGRRVREGRTVRNWTRRDLAERSGVSVRFLVQLEAGRANISVRRLADLARALDRSPADLLDEHDDAPPLVIALLGLRGAGKTTIGRRLARRMRLPFVELDRRIEEAADLSLAELFSLHGEEYYRRLERDTLVDVLAERRPMVLATGGGLVTAGETFALLRRAATTIWLRASPEDHWNRVVRQGDRRPMTNHPQAMADLRSLLAARDPLYATAAFTVETTGKAIDRIVEEVRTLVAGPPDAT
ncbi:MAG: helix-turn-helix domain-containing protein [Acidobacteria bacterium]|nr:helix-turn-helix domain-containing protein [Acidobacteriota bacterium]